jgi:hypothetical protein
MKFRRFSALILPVAMLALVGSVPNQGWLREANAGENPSTGIVSITVASALSCPNIACASGDTCTFQTFTGAAQSFTRFGAGLNKATLLACMVIDHTSGVKNGNTGLVDTTCDPATGTIVLTTSSKSGVGVTIAFAGTVCTLPAPGATTKEVLNSAYILSASTDKSIASAQGNFTAGYDIVSNQGSAAFSGTRD